MLGIVIKILCFPLVWIAWGFVPMLVFIAVVAFLSWVAKPQYSFQVNWGALAGSLLLTITGVFAVYTITDGEPAYTAAAIVIAFIAEFT